MPVAVVTDSTHYLPRDLIAEYEIHQVSLYVNDGGTLTREGEMPDFHAFYEDLRARSDLPTTSQPSPGDFIAVYEPLIEQGYDIASGWRKNRIDNAVTRKIPSRIANWLMAKASGIELHDFGTTFKAYRAEILKDVNLYGELHRFIPALASFYGARIVEVPIKNVPRGAGASHYGLERTMKVFFDIITIRFLLTYFTRPMHFFGKFGLLGLTSGGAIMAYLLVYKLLDFQRDLVTDHGPLMVLGAILVLGGLMLFSTGLLGEIMIRTYFESQGRRIYAVREIRARKDGVASR